MSMNPEVKEQWVNALRSGDYEQGTSYLCADGKFCCLGVLCDLAEKDGVVLSTDTNYPSYPDHTVRRYHTADQTGEHDGSTRLLPPEVMEWAGIPRDGSRTIFGDVIVRTDAWDGSDELSAINDEGATFAEIADIIEDQL